MGKDMEFVGIINLTPNSFSEEPGNSDSFKLEEKLTKWQKFGISHIDFGAESTAPMNDPINGDQELERFEQNLFPLLEKKVFNAKTTFSIDTYRSETFEVVYQKIRQNYPESSVWWNDVSGVLEEKDWELLKSLDQNTSYIYSHTFVPHKSETSHHMNFVRDELSCDDLAKEMAEKFVTFQFNWNFKGIKSELILDPCFGFSKNKVQNFGLVARLGKVFKNVAIDVPIMLGLSRKSFLRSTLEEVGFQLGDKVQINNATEVLHWQLLQKLQFDLRTRKKYIRAHDPMYFLATQRLWKHVNII